MQAANTAQLHDILFTVTPFFTGRLYPMQQPYSLQAAYGLYLDLAVLGSFLFSVICSRLAACYGNTGIAFFAHSSSPMLLLSFSRYNPLNVQKPQRDGAVLRSGALAIRPSPPHTSLHAGRAVQDGACPVHAGETPYRWRSRQE